MSLQPAPQWASTYRTLKGLITTKLWREHDRGASEVGPQQPWDSLSSSNSFDMILWTVLYPSQSTPTILWQLLPKNWIWSQSPRLNQILTRSCMCPSPHSLRALPWFPLWSLWSHPRLFAAHNLCCSPAWNAHCTLHHLTNSSSLFKAKCPLH